MFKQRTLCRIKSWVDFPRYLFPLTEYFLLAAIGILLGVSVPVYAVSCPPGPKDGAIVVPDVDGDRVKDWKFPKMTQKDKTGNKLELFCLKGRGVFALRYTDKATGKSYWVGGCFLPNGLNKPSIEKFKAGPKKGDWKKIDSFNYEPPPNGKKDWHFLFDPNTKKLTITKTSGSYARVRKGGKEYLIYMFKVVGTETRLAPEKFDDLKYKGKSLIAAYTDCRGLSQGNISLVSRSITPGEWDFEFIIPSFGGTGTEDDPIIGTIAKINAGDTLTIGGEYITGAEVHGDAVTPLCGEWTVLDVTPNEVTFGATVDANIMPADIVGSFHISSNFMDIGLVPWDSTGMDICYAGGVEGPGKLYEMEEEYTLVDGFESYTDDLDNRIFETWTGSSVDINSVTVYEGAQSMKFGYDNTEGITESMANRTFESPMDWSEHDRLSMWIHGDPNNTGGQFFVQVNEEIRVYSTVDLSEPAWQEVEIDLNFLETDLETVTLLSIGVDGNDTSGTIYIDDINVIFTPKPTEHGIDNLVHSYTFEDGTANDSLGGADGTLVGDATVVDGSLVVDGDGDWMEMTGDAIAINTYSAMTLELWSTQSVDNPFSMTASLGSAWANGTGKDYVFIATGRGDQMNRGAIANTPDEVNPWEDEVGVSSPELNDGIEHQYVLTITANLLAYYVDGVLIGTAEMGATTISGLSNDNAYLGKGVYPIDPTMNCSINEFNIYDCALRAADVAANYAAGPAVWMPVPIDVENASFELPGTEKIKGWNGEGVADTPAEDIPGWSSDSAPVDSGVETGWGATDGIWTAFLMGADPSVWQLTSHVIGADDVIELKVDAADNWAATVLQISLYYDDNGARVTIASLDAEVIGDVQEFALTLNAADAPDAVGEQLGIEFNNISAEGESWIGLDNVRLSLIH